MKKIITLILISISATFAVADDYSDSFKLYELNERAKSATVAKSAVELFTTAQNVKNVENDIALTATAQSAKTSIESFNAIRSAFKFAELRLWYLQQTKPKIFIQIATADNATDMGYFRWDYEKENDLGKLKLLNEYDYLF